MNISEIVLGVFAFALIIGSSAFVNALMIEPGETYTANCTSDCTNGTLEIECNQSESCGVCQIERVLSWNETYTNDNGACDLDITCEDFNWSRMGMVSFPMEINVKKDDNGTMDVIIEIFDRNGEKLRTWEDKMKSDDIVEQKIKHEFSCPAELSTDINMATCAPYLMRVLNSSDPMMLQMVTGQTIATQELVSCMSQLDSEMELKNTEKIRAVTCTEQKDSMKEELDKYKFDMENPNGQRAKDVESAKAEFGFYAFVWSILFFLSVLVFVTWFSINWYNSNRFGGG